MSFRTQLAEILVIVTHAPFQGLTARHMYLLCAALASPSEARANFHAFRCMVDSVFLCVSPKTHQYFSAAARQEFAESFNGWSILRLYTDIAFQQVFSKHRLTVLERFALPGLEYIHSEFANLRSQILPYFSPNRAQHVWDMLPGTQPYIDMKTQRLTIALSLGNHTRIFTASTAGKELVSDVSQLVITSSNPNSCLRAVQWRLLPEYTHRVVGVRLLDAGGSSLIISMDTFNQLWAAEHRRPVPAMPPYEKLKDITRELDYGMWPFPNETTPAEMIPAYEAFARHVEACGMSPPPGYTSPLAPPPYVS
ncbi:hypothetical protein DL93DRAFT_2171383 [Clavulina sp. PMI_390]|nr:hypothetical protein DL93DRAFT_2171383 [Clavulina sp. PMI_390]